MHHALCRWTYDLDVFVENRALRKVLCPMFATFLLYSFPVFEKRPDVAEGTFTRVIYYFHSAVLVTTLLPRLHGQGISRRSNLNFNLELKTLYPICASSTICLPEYRVGVPVFDVVEMSHTAINTPHSHGWTG